MEQVSVNRRPSAFSCWLRTGKSLPIQDADDIELKFNPWHDPEDGRFTYAGAGRYHGAGGGGASSGTRDRTRRTVDGENSPAPRPASLPKRELPRAGPAAGNGGWPARRGPAARSGPATGSRSDDRSNIAVEFVGGVGEGLYDVARGTVGGAYAAVTTNPVTTVGNIGRGIAGRIDRAIAAEDRPAHVQIARAAGAVANASARDIGRATGSVVGNAALTVAPGVAVGRVSAARSLRAAELRPTYDPPEIGWVKENLGPKKDWTIYNDGATGARPGQAPTLMRTMPDGRKRPVKFDGFEGEYVIDRKLGIRDMRNARAQSMRQSDVLRQHTLIGTWEVPNVVQRAKALKMLKRLGIRNIKVRIVKP